jgi:enoyl-CoA hydratase
MTSAAQDFVTWARDGGTATVALVNATPMNILGSDAIEQLTATFGDLARDDEIRVVVLRGSGDRAFIGGADLNEMARLDRPAAEAFIRRLARLCEAIRGCPAPVVARLAGWCLGAGLEVAMSCDLRLAAAGARLGMPEVAVGIPSVIHAALLPPMIGASRTAWLLLTGETIDAGTAERWGLVHEVVADDELDARVAALAGRLGSFGPGAVRQQKRLLNKWLEMNPRSAIEDSVEQFGLAFLTGEPRQHMTAFLGRRTRS